MERGTLAGVPFASAGSGEVPLVVLPGLALRVGVPGDRQVRNVLSPLRGVGDRRRLVVLDRWPGLPDGLTLATLAARYAAALTELGAPVDVLGVSTGGSIAQVLAADHPHLVRRLALVSTACRLGPGARDVQAEIARLLGHGAVRAAGRAMAGSVVPPVLAPLARPIGWILAPVLVGGSRAASDLRLTLEAEDGFDLTLCTAPIEAPTLVVGGGRDRFYPRSLFEETARLIPHSQLLVRPRRGHVNVAGDRVVTAHLAGFFTAP
ncbi:alpha/beta fold hydrolase [Cellulomonas sp. McL0617]|uniref:alpha/beta fold hydrolase n=1 Tax=Cellulomonas sp. McL0617 TaxID=3415675 RepID=UPI003CE8482D